MCRQEFKKRQSHAPYTSDTPDFGKIIVLVILKSLHSFGHNATVEIKYHQLSLMPIMM
jgi:hypothetical protein